MAAARPHVLRTPAGAPPGVQHRSGRWLRGDEQRQVPSARSSCRSRLRPQRDPRSDQPWSAWAADPLIPRTFSGLVGERSATSAGAAGLSPALSRDLRQVVEEGLAAKTVSFAAAVVDSSTVASSDQPSPASRDEQRIPDASVACLGCRRVVALACCGRIGINAGLTWFGPLVGVSSRVPRPASQQGGSTSTRLLPHAFTGQNWRTNPESKLSAGPRSTALTRPANQLSGASSGRPGRGRDAILDTDSRLLHGQGKPLRTTPIADPLGAPWTPQG